jgi:RNA polymerase sigma-70 factor (ECF subfamily)
MSYTQAEHTPENPDADAALVASSQQGDLSAFEALVAKHQKRMLNIAFRIVGEYDDACEVVQDAFVSAYKNIKAFRQEAKFSTWLTAITVNLSRNRLKRMKIQQARVPVSLDAPIRTDDGEVMPDPPSKEPSVLDRLEKQDVKQKVQDCIKALEPDFREVLVLRDMQDLSYDEIGAILKVAAGTVKSRLFRARESVKDCLKRTMGDLL